MTLINESNRERQKFVKKICQALNFRCQMDANDICIMDNTASNMRMSYENWVRQYFKRGLVTQEVGDLRVVNGAIEVLIPNAQGCEWYTNKDLYHSNNNLVANTTFQIYGLPPKSSTYFSLKNRPLLYDINWSKCKVTKKEIAEKFGVELEQLQIID
jgi:hypothetical protein